MGANFVTISIPADIPNQEVRAQFQSAQDDDRYSNGHEYSGGLGMASGLTFTDKEFENVDDAEAYLSDAVQKWKDALAVKHKTLDGNKMWLIGAMCAC